MEWFWVCKKQPCLLMKKIKRGRQQQWRYLLFGLAECICNYSLAHVQIHKDPSVRRWYSFGSELMAGTQFLMGQPQEVFSGLKLSNLFRPLKMIFWCYLQRSFSITLQGPGSWAGAVSLLDKPPEGLAYWANLLGYGWTLNWFPHGGKLLCFHLIAE